MVFSRALSRTRIVVGIGIAVLGAGIAAGVATTASASEADEAAAAPLPGPKSFVSGLDLECFNTQGPALNLTVQLTHLNPVLRNLGLPVHKVVLRELVQTCVPVAKNGVAPPPAAAPFIQHVDLACYRVDADPLPIATPLNLTHLNPVLAGLPEHKVTLVQPSKLCVPVSKNGINPPPDVLPLIQFIDLECYRVDAGLHPAFGVSVKQLNPQLGNIPTHELALTPQPREMCVPVQKNNQAIPPAIVAITQWIDLEKFTASPVVAVPPVTVTLSHLNPLLVTLPRVTVVLQQAASLMVPVAKNGMFPPPP